MEQESAYKYWLESGAGGGSRTHTALRPTDFESAASAIPPLRRANILGYLENGGNFLTAVLFLPYLARRVDNASQCRAT